MSNTASSILSLIAPQFDADTRRTTMLSLAAGQLSPSAWGFGERYQSGVAHLAAHMMTRFAEDAAAAAGAAEGAGPVTSRTAGDVSEAYGSWASGMTGLPLDDAALMTTRYGVEFVRLRRGLATAGAGLIRPGG